MGNYELLIVSLVCNDAENRTKSIGHQTGRVFLTQMKF